MDDERKLLRNWVDHIPHVGETDKIREGRVDMLRSFRGFRAGDLITIVVSEPKFYIKWRINNQSVAILKYIQIQRREVRPMAQLENRGDSIYFYN